MKRRIEEEEEYMKATEERTMKYVPLLYLNLHIKCSFLGYIVAIFYMRR